MPKRLREDEKARAGTANVAYGAVNKAGDTIPFVPIVRPAVVSSNSTLRVAAWNLNGLRSFVEKRGALLSKLWKQEQLDILGITEHKITEQDKADLVEVEIKKILKSAGVEKEVKFVWNMSSVKKGYAGSLAIVRQSVFDKCTKVQLAIGGSDPEGRVISLLFDSVAVVIAYVPNSGQTLERLNYRITSWDKQFATHCLDLNEKKKFGVIVAGDLNVAHRDVDIWNVDAPHVPKGAGTTPQERKSFEDLLLKKGLADTFASAHPEATGWFTYWSVRARNKPKNRGLRLDYVLADKTKTTVADAYISPELAADGDHCPVGVVLEGVVL